jgi:hypothetical protein
MLIIRTIAGSIERRDRIRRLDNGVNFLVFFQAHILEEAFVMIETITPPLPN